MDSFFGIGLPELILILLIAGIIMGPERIGHIARWLGKTTAQLQAISRGFMQQLQNELDGIDDGDALKEAMVEVQALRQELESIRTEFTSVANNAKKEGKTAVADIENAIQPPSLMSAKTGQTNTKQTAVVNAANASTHTPNGNPTQTDDAPLDLPHLKDVPDDPES